MCVKYFADGDVHKYFNPYDSPYDSYINFMNVLDNLRARLRTHRKKFQGQVRTFRTKDEMTSLDSEAVTGR